MMDEIQRQFREEWLELGPGYGRTQVFCSAGCLAADWDGEEGCEEGCE
jgi:hypothetical protein